MDLDRRENEYGRLQCEGQPKIYYSIKKHGWDKHKWFKFEYPVEVLDEILAITNKMWDEKESHAMIVGYLQGTIKAVRGHLNNNLKN